MCGLNVSFDENIICRPTNRSYRTRSKSASISTSWIGNEKEVIAIKTLDGSHYGNKFRNDFTKFLIKVHSIVQYDAWFCCFKIFCIIHSSCQQSSKIWHAFLRRPQISATIIAKSHLQHLLVFSAEIQSLNLTLQMWACTTEQKRNKTTTKTNINENCSHLQADESGYAQNA